MAATTTRTRRGGKLGGMIAVSGDGPGVLGYICWYSVPDEQVPLRTLKRHWMVSGLDPTPLPANTRAIDTFKRSMRAQDGRHRKNGHIRENVVKIVLETREDVVYQVSTTVRDLEDRIIEFPKALRVTFNKNTERIGFKPLGEVKRGEVVELMSDIQDYYDDHGTHITGAKVRTLVRNYLKDEPDEQTGRVGLSGENLRGKAGGIYFVPAEHRDQLDSLSTMLDELYKGLAYMHLVPMADTATEREIIRRHHVGNVRDELKDMILNAKSLSGPRDRAPRKDSIEFHLSQYFATTRKIARYKELLGEEAEELDRMSQLVKKQLDKVA